MPTFELNELATPLRGSAWGIILAQSLTPYVPYGDFLAYLKVAGTLVHIIIFSLVTSTMLADCIQKPAEKQSETRKMFEPSTKRLQGVGFAVYCSIFWTRFNVGRRARLERSLNRLLVISDWVCLTSRTGTAPALGFCLPTISDVCLALPKGFLLKSVLLTFCLFFSLTHGVTC